MSEYPPLVRRYPPTEPVCQYDDGQCDGPASVVKDPYLYELYDEAWWVALCGYHYGERAADV